jgi:putative nucleotidyltransferase with HDIG domain
MTTTAEGASRPQALRAYVAGVSVAGGVLFLCCLAHLAGTGVPPAWWIFAGLALITGRITLRVPGVEATFTVSEVFTFTCVLLFGPEAGAVTLALDSLVLAWHRRMAVDKVCFNFANLTLAVWTSGALFFRVAGVDPLFGRDGPAAELILPIAILGAAYFVINTGLIALAIGFESGTNPLQVWRRHFMRLSPGYAASASLSLLLLSGLQQVHFGAIALLPLPPLLLVFYFTLRSSFGRLEDAKGHLDKLNTLYLSTVETLATAIDAKDEVTHGHIRRVQLGAMGLARELGIKDPDTLKALEAAALLHDTGKIAIPEHILNKPGKLTPAEYDKMKLHAPIGAEILSAIDFPYPVVPMVRHHHENWDGTGYPDRIAGTDIPIGARILSVVDCFDALTSDRPYRKRMTDEDALAILHERRGTMYDPLVVDVFSTCYRRIMPVEETVAHPATRAVGGARQPASAPVETADSEAASSDGAINEVLTISSLARAVSGNASVSDVGALAWMTLRNVVPATAMALFVEDERQDLMTVAFAAGSHAPLLRQLKKARGGGIAGWVAVNRRGVLNAEAALDLGLDAGSHEAPLRGSVTVPLTHDGRVVGVLSCYSAAMPGFTEDHLRLLELAAASLGSALAAVDHSETAALPVAASSGGRRGASVLSLVRG